MKCLTHIVVLPVYIAIISEFMSRQESIPVGCVLSASITFFNDHQMSLLREGPVQRGLVNKFEQVSIDGHQMSLVGRGWGWRLPGLMSGGGAGPGWRSPGLEGGCTVGSSALLVMFT